MGLGIMSTYLTPLLPTVLAQEQLYQYVSEAINLVVYDRISKLRFNWSGSAHQPQPPWGQLAGITCPMCVYSMYYHPIYKNYMSAPTVTLAEVRTAFKMGEACWEYLFDTIGRNIASRCVEWSAAPYIMGSMVVAPTTLFNTGHFKRYGAAYKNVLKTTQAILGNASPQSLIWDLCEFWIRAAMKWVNPVRTITVPLPGGTFLPSFLCVGGANVEF